MTTTKKMMNRLDNLPQEIILEIYSYIENDSHKATHKKLYLDKTFINLMWDKYYLPFSDFYYNDFYDGKYRPRYYTTILTNKTYHEVDKEFNILCYFRKEKKILPSDIHINDFYDFLIVNGERYEYFNYSKAYNKLMGFFMATYNNFFSIKPSTIRSFLKNSTYSKKSHSLEEIKKLQEEKKYYELIGIIHFDRLVEGIYYSYLSESCYESEICRKVFGERMTVLRNGFISKI